MVQWQGKPAPTGRGADDWLNAGKLEEQHDLHAQKAEWRGKTKRELVLVRQIEGERPQNS
jgi:hypothetical protein